MSNNEERKIIQDKLLKISELIIGSRHLLSILQKIKIETQRSKGWIFGSFFGASRFTMGAKHQSRSNIQELIKDAKRKSSDLKSCQNILDLKFELSILNQFTDLFISTPIASLSQYQMVNKLRKDVDKYLIKLEEEITLLEEEEEVLSKKLKGGS